MGFWRKVKKTTEVFLGIGLAAGAIGAWALAPRSRFMRKLQGAIDVPGEYFAHRGLHDSGSGIAGDQSRASEEEREYVEVVQKLAANFGSVEKENNSPEAVTQDWSLTQPVGMPISFAPENSLSSFAAASQRGYGIELDVHLTKDGQVVVIHDDDLKRVAGDRRRVSDLTYEELCRIPLSTAHSSASYQTEKRTADQPRSSSSDGKSQRGRHKRLTDHTEPIHVPLLSDVLELVDGKVPLIIEYKMGPKLDMELMQKADAILSAYKGAYAIESFNPLALAWYRYHRSSVCRGQLASSYPGKPRSRSELFKALAGSLMFNWLGRPDFVAYEWHGGDGFPMRVFRALGGIPVAWTLRSRENEVRASSQFDHFIFEGYLPPSEASEPTE